MNDQVEHVVLAEPEPEVTWPGKRTEDTPRDKIYLQGQWRHLKFTLPVLQEFERLTGVNAVNGQVLKNGTPNAKVVPAMLWAGMITDEPELKLEQVTKWLEPWQFNEAWECCLAAYLFSLENPHEKKAKTKK